MIERDERDGICKVCGLFKKFITKPHPTKEGWVIVEDICKRCSDKLKNPYFERDVPVGKGEGGKDELE